MTWTADLREAWSIAWATLRANKLRAGLTTLGIVIGIVTVTLMGTAIQGIRQSFHTTISVLGTDVLYIQKFSWFSDEEWWRVRNRKDITMMEVRALQREATLSRLIVPEAYFRANVRRNAKRADGVTLVGTTEQSFLVRGFTLAAGRFMTAPEVAGGRPVCVLGADVATNFFPQSSPVGEWLNIGGARYDIVGVMAPIDKFLGMGSDNHILIPVTQLVSQFDLRPNMTILAKVLSLPLMEDAREEIRGILRKVRHVPPGAPDDFGINQQDAFLKMFNRVGGTLATVGLFITGLSLFVGGIGIMNIMFVSVAERTREIGIRKAIGAKRRTILIQFLTEAACISLVGGLIGLSLAAPLTLFVGRFMPASLSMMLCALALLVSVLTGLISGFIPAYRASLMNPVDALRAE